jgi:hypothetical protein
MNERILKLTEQATEHDYTTWDSYNQKELVYYKFNKEKFAQLIVRECMNAVCDPRTTYLESMTDSSAMYTARERIRKHFGVKE